MDACPAREGGTEMKRATQEPVYPDAPPPGVGWKRVARETLASGRLVHIDQQVDGLGKVSVIIRVGGDAGWATRTLPVWSFPFFGKPLARRIREAIILLDCPIETEEEQDEVVRAAEVALFHSGPLDEGMHSSRQEAPLIAMPDDPPSE
jgi:hypothetical protein